MMANDWGDAPAKPNDWGDAPATVAKPAAIQQPEGGATGRFLKGAWDTLNPLPALRMVVDLAHTAADPAYAATPEGQKTGQTIKGIIDSHIEQAQKAKQSWDQGNYSEAAGHLLGAVVPLVGPAAAQAGEQIGGSAPQFDKYGNVVNPGQAPDVAGGLGRGAGLVASVAAPDIAKAAVKGAESAAPGITSALENSARTQYSRVLNATKQGNKLRSAEIVPQLIDRGYAGLTLKGLQSKAVGNLARVGQAIGDAWDGMPEGTAVDLKTVLNGIDRNAADLTENVPVRQVGTKTVDTGLLDASGSPITRDQPIMKGGPTPKGPIAQQGLANVERLKKSLADMAEPNPETGAMEIPVQRLWAIRQYFDKVSKLAGRFEGKTLSDASMAEAHSMAADAIRAQLNDYPGMAALNKEYSFWKDVNQVVSDTLQRRQGQARPLSAKITKGAATAAGFGTGGPHGAVLGYAVGDALDKLATSPAWQTVSAVMKDRLAKAIAAGDKAGTAYWVDRISKSVAPGAAVNVLRQQNALPAPVSGQ